MNSTRTRSSRLRTPAARMLAGGLASCLCALAPAAPAASFVNLGFESSPSFPAGDYNFPFTVYPNALPGWTVHFGTNIQAGACANEFLLDAPAVALMTSSGNQPPIEGQKMVYLQSSATMWNDPASVVNVAISQVGLVPAGSQFLRLQARNQWFDSFPLAPGPLEVRLGGQAVQLVTVRSNAGNAEYLVDVSPWTGQTAELSIGVLASNTCCGPNFPEGWAMVDSISFQPGVRLDIAVSGTNTLLLSWPSNAVDSLPFVLHQADSLGAAQWTAVTNPPAYANGTNRLVLPLRSSAGFYRLKLVP